MSVVRLCAGLSCTESVVSMRVLVSCGQGGPTGSTGDHNNYPMRGGKDKNWEGGVRGVGFVRGTNSALAKVPAGSTTSELMHSVDWLPTLVLLGGGSIASTRPLDGFDIWDVISKGAKAKRQIIAHNVPKRGYAGAFRLGPHKVSTSSLPFLAAYATVQSTSDLGLVCVADTPAGGFLVLSSWHADY